MLETRKFVMAILHWKQGLLCDKYTVLCVCAIIVIGVFVLYGCSWTFFLLFPFQACRSDPAINLVEFHLLLLEVCPHITDNELKVIFKQPEVNNTGVNMHLNLRKLL